MKWTPPRRTRAVALLGALSAPVLLGAVCPAVAQEDAASGADSAALVKRAHRDQAAFEQRRVQLLSTVPPDDACGPPAQREGRFCFWYHDDWKPTPEPPAIAPLRRRLLAQLDSIGARVPGDAWVLGQRVWYRAEAGRWRDALRVARTCGGASAWWCAALEGFALHGLGRYPEAARAFTRALGVMDSTRARRWRIPRRVLDGTARKMLEDAPVDSLGPRLRRLWTLADPLYLVPGNDRETAHYARRTVARIREDASSPYLVPWGSDLEDLMIRYGWEVGWERRSPNVLLEGPRGAVGHWAGQGRSFVPSGKVLRGPAAARARDLQAEEAATRSEYTPAYAPVLLPMSSQVALFPRGDSFAVVASAVLPPDTTADTTWATPDGRPLPLLASGELADGPDQAGLFLVPESGGPPRTDTIRSGESSGAFLLEAPAGRYVMSVESWSPHEGRAGRYRVGLVEDSGVVDVPTLSELLLLDGDGPDVHTLRAALPWMLRRPVVARGRRIAVGWELAGPGWRPETVTYRLSVERTDEGLLHRAGRWLHLEGPRHALTLSWQEPGPERGGYRFHRLALDLPDPAPGRYEIRLEARIPGRSALVSRRLFRVERRAPGTGP